MKKITSFSLLAFVLLTFYGCPVSSSYPLGKQGEYKIDPNLLGTWITEQVDHEVSKVIITKKDDFTYNIKVMEKGDMFMAETDNFTGWTTKLEDQTFLCLKESETGYYVYKIDKEGKNKMITHDISLKVKGTDAITSIEEYRKEVASSMSYEDFLSSEALWKKE